MTIEATAASCRRLVAGTVCVAALLATQRLALADESTPASTLARTFNPSLTYDGTLLANLRGGARSGSTYFGNLHLRTSIEGEALGLPGSSAFMDLLDIHGGQPARFTADAQGVSNTAGPNGGEVEELWLQHNFRSGHASVLAGIYDLNSEFYRLKSAALFVNSSFGMGPEFARSGVEGPSIFPRTSAGLRLSVQPTPNTTFRVAVLDGVPVARPDGSHAVFRRGDGLLEVVEFAALARTPASDDPPANARVRIGRFSSLVPYDDKFALGAWRYTGRADDLSDRDVAGDPVRRHGSAGAYVVGERVLVGQGRVSGGHLAAFFQAGVADAKANRFDSYLGAGATASGWGTMQDGDQLGISVAHARNGSHYVRGSPLPGDDRAETTVELTGVRQLTRVLTVQPDLQYVVHPDTDPARANALALQVHFELAF